jgi:hypothetical protein
VQVAHRSRLVTFGLLRQAGIGQKRSLRWEIFCDWSVCAKNETACLSHFTCRYWKNLVKRFSIYRHPDCRVEAVKVGISVPGLFFGPAWLLWHRLWFLGLLTSVLSMACYILLSTPFALAFGIPYNPLSLFGLADLTTLATTGTISYFGNKWRMKSLESKGFENMGNELASSPQDAKIAFLKRS